MKTFNEIMEVAADVWHLGATVITNTYRVGNGTVAVNLEDGRTLFICGDDVGISDCAAGVRFSFFEDENLEYLDGDYLIVGYVLQPVNLQ